MIYSLVSIIRSSLSILSQWLPYVRMLIKALEQSIHTFVWMGCFVIYTEGGKKFPLVGKSRIVTKREKRFIILITTRNTTQQRRTTRK